MGEEEVVTPALLCAIGNAGPRLWSLRGFDLFLFEDRLVVARVTMKETWSAFREFDRGLKKPMKAALAQRMRLDARGAQLTADLVGAHPANRMVATSAVREAELRRGRIFPKLELTLSDGETLTWRWWAPANRSFEDVHGALRRMLGSRLQHSR